jgi:hypothetical protein
MTALNPLLFFLSIAAGIAAWSLVFWINWEWMQQGGHKRIFTFLASIHVFRYIGLVALVPLHVDPAAFGFSQTYLMQVAFGDFIASILAMVAIVAVRQEWKIATLLTWAFFLEGTADTLNAGPNFALHITNQNLVGAMGWSILTVYVPAIVVTELLLGIHLVRYALKQRNAEQQEVTAK